MKFRKEYQTYLLIVIAIITAGYYFLNPFFFNKKKKVIEGQAGTTTYYRIAFNSTDLSKLLNTLSTSPTPTEQDLLKQLILTQYDTVTTDATGIKYVMPDTKYSVLIPVIPATLLIKDSTEEIIGLKVVGCTGNKLDFFNKEAAAAADTAAATADTATAAVAAYDYARLNLSNTYKDNVNIMALIAAANLLTIIGQPNITTYTEAVVTTAKNAVVNAVDAHAAAAYTAYTANNYAGFVATYAKNAADYAAAGDADYAVTFAAYAAAQITTTGSESITNNVNYKKVINKYNRNPANMKAAFITAAGIIYQSMSLFIV